MKSILQSDDCSCFLCGRNRNVEPLDKHHVFGGAMRDKSEKYGLTVYLHHSQCHIFGKNSAHGNAEVGRKLKAYAQREAMKKYGWSVSDFIRIFGRSYID